MQNSESLGLVLSGGGARGAYQSGVLKALLEIDPHLRFSIISGFSAGAINAAYLASHADDFLRGARTLVAIWENLKPSQVYDTSAYRVLLNGLRLVWDLSFGGIHRRTSTQSLLDTRPLRKLISESTDFDAIERHIQSQALKAFSVGATDYGTAESVSFYRDHGEMEAWYRKRRRAEPVKFRPEHILASSSLPVLFPAVDVGGSFYGDGSLRNVAPLSSAIHLGSDRLVIVGVRKQKERFDQKSQVGRPSLGRIIGVILNAILLDTTDTDVERLARINLTLKRIPKEQRDPKGLREVDFLWLTPTEDLGVVASDYVRDLPGIVRYLLRGLGSRAELSELASYLLFDSRFCTRLVEIGFDDTIKRKDEVLRWLSKKYDAA